MGNMTDTGRIDDMYVKKDTLSTRLGLHEKYSVNPYGWNNWVFDQYAFHKGMRVLELGCGTGAAWQGREGRLPGGMEIVLTDYSPLMVEKAKSALSGNPAFSFLQADIQEIPFEDGEFDAVIANHMLYHVPGMDKALREIRRVLKEDGCFYATTLGENSLKELNAIYHRLEGKASFSYSGNVTFTLENGGAQLAACFPRVERRLYADALRVTDANDLMAYVLSYNRVPEDVQGELHALIVDVFSKDGAFHITKEQGMFVCAGQA